MPKIKYTAYFRGSDGKITGSVTAREARRIKLTDPTKWADLKPRLHDNGYVLVAKDWKSAEFFRAMPRSHGGNATGYGDSESAIHLFFKEVFSNLTTIKLRIGDEEVLLYGCEGIKEGIPENSRREIDVIVKFQKSSPEHYCEDWNGLLAIEVYHTHSLIDDPAKIAELQRLGIPVIEFDVNKWRVVPQYLDTAWYLKDYIDMFDGAIGNKYITGKRWFPEEQN